MRKQIEHLLLIILIGTSVLLVLTFWLNTKFGFNLFSSQHWNELAMLQASGEPIDNGFYISIGVALLVFIICLNIIFLPRSRKTDTQTEQPISIQTQPVTNIPLQPETPETKIPDSKPTTNQPQQPVNMVRPQRLNIPKNSAEIAATQYAQQKQNENVQSSQYDEELKNIFIENSFVVKHNPTISGFKSNLFAIGPDEIIWIGGVDCDINKLKTAINRLESTFTETLEDISITVNAFLIDTQNKYDSDERILIFHDISDLKQYVSEHPGNKITDSGREDFDAYSEYIDTVLTLLYKT